MYLWIAVIAYLLFAINAVIDKFLLGKKRIEHPATYAFGIGLLGLVVVVLMPFGFSVPEAADIVLSLFTGILFTFALLFFFAALKRGEASRVVPVQAGFVPFFTLIFAYILLNERLDGVGLAAFILLIAGALIMHPRAQYNNLLALISALLFALSFTLTKQVFGELGFINGFIWTRFGMALGALFLLFDSHARAAIFGVKTAFRDKKKGKSTAILFFAGQGLGALASIFQNLAIALGSVILVNALQGVQFAFLFGLTYVLSSKYPKILKEDFKKEAMAHKIVAILLITAGVIILAIL